MNFSEITALQYGKKNAEWDFFLKNDEKLYT